LIVTRRIAPLPLISLAIASFTWMAPFAVSNAVIQSQSLQDDANQVLSPNQVQLPTSDRVAQLFYPPVNDEQQALMVVGQGEASAPADRAEVEFSFTNYDPYASPEGGLLLFNSGSTSNGSTSNGATEAPSLRTQASPIPSFTEAQLQPVVDALVAAGISSELIEVAITPGSPNVYPYTTDRGSVSFDLSNPSREQINQAVDAVNEAIADSQSIFLQNLSVRYSLNDCTALEQDVYLAAISNARSRATALASAMGVELAEVPSVAESPFNFLLPACGSADGAGFYNPFAFGASLYDPEAPAEVQVRRDIFVTFPIR
jgi:uncharacterized protein YggE